MWENALEAPERVHESAPDFTLESACRVDSYDFSDSWLEPGEWYLEKRQPRNDNGDQTQVQAGNGAPTNRLANIHHLNSACTVHTKSARSQITCPSEMKIDARETAFHPFGNSLYFRFHAIVRPSAKLDIQAHNTSASCLKHAGLLPPLKYLPLPQADLLGLSN
ncbi:hypothetical protein FA13DRAFT_1194995 [Coprinellus micaceus]|uniref:Uncharacterized protein n=1 Tax=Coprinellus micaceus TaxID=71717 RepID=A0A4Y7RB44_COPMI|nr:hypothetical protein FA13DRAFT_1194995 [Coprinellus micaceus]